MAITVIEMVDILRAELLASELMTDAKKPNGAICKLQRPQGSKLEDVVISTLGGNRDDVQKGVLLLNIYVPNLDPLLIPPLNGDRSQPDLARLTYLSKLTQKSIPGELWADNGEWTLEITHDSIYKDENDQHYAGFRIDFFTIK